MGPTGSHLRALVNLSGSFHEGGQQAVYDILRENGYPTGHDFDEGPSLVVWVTLLSTMPEPAAREYVELLERNGATGLISTLDLVRLVGNTQQERIAWMVSQGVRLAHAPTLVRCIEKYAEYIEWAPPLPTHRHGSFKQNVGKAQEGGREAAMLDVGTANDPGSHLVSPTETPVPDKAAVAERDRAALPLAQDSPFLPLLHRSSPVRLLEGSPKSSKPPPEELVPCLGGMHESRPLSDLQPAPIVDSGVSEFMLPHSESSRADVQHQPAELGPLPSVTGSDTRLPLASSEAADISPITADMEGAGALPLCKGAVGREGMRTRSRRTEEETQAPVDGSTTVDLCEPTALEAASAESWGGNGSYHVLLSSSSDTDEGDAGRPEVETEADSEKEQQGQGAGALEAVGQRLGLAVETQNVDALLSSLRSLLQALLTASQEQTDSGVVLRDEELAAIVLPLMRASYIHAETLHEAPATAVRRIWMQVVLHLGALVSTGEGAQWAKLKEALLEEQISDVLVNRLKLRLEGWTEEKDDDGEGNSAVSSLLAVLSSLARHAEDHRLSEALGQAGACEVALQALTTGLESRHATLLGASCCAMMSLCFRHPPNVGRLLELQAHAKVVQTLNVTMGQGEATNGTAPVQAKGGQGKQAQVLASWACSCLASLMDYAPSPTAKQELQAQLGALGLPESLATLLRFKRLQAEPDALVLVMAAVVALLKGSKRNRARLREAGALQTLQAMSLLGGHASDRARSLRTRGDNVPRGSNTKGQEAYPELRLRVERALEMLRHVEMEVEEPGSALNWVKQEDEASTELSKRPRTERSQAECELDLQGTREGRLDEPQAGDKGIRAASNNDWTYFSGDDMEHDGQMYPVPQQPRSSEPPPAHQSQKGELNGTMMDLEQVEEASGDDMEVFPLDDPDGGAMSIEDDDDEAEAGHEPHLVEPTPTYREGGRSSMGREQEAAMGEKGQQHAETTPPEVERLQGISTDPQPPPSVSEDVSALALMLGEANTSGDAAKASEALRRLIKADPPLEAPGERDELLPVLVQGLAIFADRVSVIKHALAYLLDLTTNKLCCKQLMDMGVDRALASVIMASLHSLDLTKNACTVVLHMATWGYHEVSTELLVAVRAALKKYLKAGAVLQAFRSLLVPGSQALKVLAEDGGGLMVARVLRWTSSRFGQLQAALECISSMCIGDSDVATTNRRHLGSQGVIDAIDSAITRCPKRAEILSAAVLALWALSIDSDRNVQLMRTAGITTRLKGPGFQQIVQHHDCHMESCAVCLRLDLLRKLEATTSSEDDQCDDSRGRRDEALDEASDILACEMEVVPFNGIDTQDAPNGGREDEEEIRHGLHLNEQSKRPRTAERQAMRREHEAAISKERVQHAQATRPEVGRLQGMITKPQRRAGVSTDVSALMLMLGEANTSSDAAKASDALERLIQADPPLQAHGEQDEVLPVLVQALAIFADKAFVTKPALAYLVDITSDEATCKQLMDLGVDRALASVIMASLQSSEMTKNACTVVLHMATWGYHEVSTELLVAVRAAVKKYFWSRTVFQACRSLLVPGSQALKVLAEDGGGEAVVRVVRWPSTRAMQVEAAFECISGMCMGDSDAAAVNRRHFGSEGAIEAIGSVFSEHPKRPEVFSAGVKALWALSINNDSNVQLMQAAGVAARLRGPGFRQSVKHHDCHLESCDMCLRLELLRKLEATTSSEHDECDGSRRCGGEALDEGSEELDCERKIVPIDATDRRDVPMRRVIEKKEEGGHGSPLDEQSKKPRAQVRRGVKRQHEAAILNERRQCAKAEHFEAEAPRRTSVEQPPAEVGSQSVKAFALILSEANTSSNAAEASKVVCRLQTDPPPCLGSGHWNRLLAVLTRTLVVFADIASVVTPVLSYLEVVTGSASRCQQLLALGVDAALVAVMKGNKASPGIMHKACAVVLNMATRSCHEVSTELVVTVRDAVNKSTTGIALDALNALAVPGSHAYMMLAQDDGYAALVRIVRETQRKSATVQSALQCIVTLCLGDSEAAVVNRQQLGAQGAIEAIDLALNRYSNRVEVLSTAIRALYTLSIDSSLVVRMKDREVAVRLTGPGFQQYVQDPECSVDFCEMCLRLVVNMALSSVEMREEMGNQGACSLVLKVFERPRPSEIREEARLLTAAIEAMATMCLDCPHNVHRFGSMGCEALSQVLGCRRLLRLEMPTFKALRKQACLATARLLEAVEHRQLLLESEMLHEVAGCLQSPRLEKDVPYLEAVLLALEAMTSDDTRPLHLPAPDLVQAAIETLRSISIRGAYEVPRRVVALLSKLGGHAGVTVPGVNFLCNLMRPSHDDEMVRLRETLGTYGACSVAAEAIGLRNGEPDGQVIGSGYLLAAALCLKCPANVQRLIALQVPASVLHDLRTAAEAHRGDADDGAIGIGLSGCCFLGQLLVNATGLGDREKLTQELRQDGACEALLAFLKSSAVCGQADKEQAVITTVERLLEGHEGTGHLEVASARALLESAIARGNDNSKDDGSSTSAQKR